MRNSQQMFKHSHRSTPPHEHRGLKDKGADCSFHKHTKTDLIKSLLVFFGGGPVKGRVLDRIILTYLCCSDRGRHFPVQSDVARLIR